MSDGVQKLFDVKATDDSQHDADETDNSVESDVSTRVIVNDDAVDGRRSPMTLGVLLNAPLQRHYHPDYGGELGRILQN